MNVSGVSPAMTGAANLNLASSASIKVMDLAQNVTEDVMGTLIDSMDAIISGLGQNIDMSV